MYFSLIETKQLGQKLYSKSSTLKKPYIKTDVWTANINGKIIKSNMRSIEGEKIIRDSKTTAWKLSLNHSFRDESGKVHKHQAYIKTIHYWEIVERFLWVIKDSKESDIQDGDLAFGFCDGEWFDKKVLKIFPDANLDEVWKLYQNKVKDLEQSIIKEFKESNEFRWWKLNQKLREEIDKLKKQEDAAKDRARQQEQFKQQTYQDTFREYEDAGKAFISTSSSAVTLSQEEAKLIDKCYKAMAVQVHPDKGGTNADMQLLNNLRDKVKKCVGTT